MSARVAAVVAGALLLIALITIAASGKDGRVELVVGGGFLGDLPHGGQTGHQAVNGMKDLVHQAASAKQMQSGIFKDLKGSSSLSGNKAKAVQAAAAEIAKILAQPSAREIVEGKSASSGAPSHDSSTSLSSSSSTSGKDPAPWLKTPKNEGEFSYSKRAPLRRVVSDCPDEIASQCNEMDVASASHGW